MHVKEALLLAVQMTTATALCVASMGAHAASIEPFATPVQPG